MSMHSQGKTPLSSNFHVNAYWRVLKNLLDEHRKVVFFTSTFSDHFFSTRDWWTHDRSHRVQPNHMSLFHWGKMCSKAEDTLSSQREAFPTGPPTSEMAFPQRATEIYIKWKPNQPPKKDFARNMTLTVGHELHHQGRVSNVCTANLSTAIFLTFQGDGTSNFFCGKMKNHVSKQKSGKYFQDSLS